MPFGVCVFHSQTGAVFIVLAEVRDRPGERGDAAELDNHVRSACGTDAHAHDGDGDEGFLHE